MLALAAMAWGCNSTANSNTPIMDQSGKHTANWISDHGAAYLSNPNSCKECHGSDLLGGISTVSCSRSSTDRPAMPPDRRTPGGVARPGLAWRSRQIAARVR